LNGETAAIAELEARDMRAGEEPDIALPAAASLLCAMEEEEAFNLRAAQQKIMHINKNGCM
jgi:hypothetical protein